MGGQSQAPSTGSTIVIMCIAVWAAIVGVTLQAQAGTIDFNREIRPILSENCYTCHGPDAHARKAKLRLDTEEGAKAEVIVPGDSAASELYRRISTDDEFDRMPPSTEDAPDGLTAEQTELIRRWIDEGAEWRDHWAFVAPVKPEAPAVSDAAWPRNPIDNFVLARLDEEGLPHSPEADAATLLRRVSFDLTGLPPTLAEYAAFANSNGDAAWQAALDRLLASPHYGERMAQDWLDGARYADTNGFQNDFQRYMWPWRDWVIEAFNGNMPFDQFAVEQIAGDLLPNATLSQKVATGFHRNNRGNTEGGSIEEEWYVENRVDRVETTAGVFLGLTMGCARCHDHKYDPLSQRDFYEFYGFFNGTADRGFYEETRGNVGPQVSLPTYEQQVRIAELGAAIGEAEAAAQRAQATLQERLDAYIGQLRGESEPYSGRMLALHVPLKGDLTVARGDGKATYGNEVGPTWSDGLLGPALELDGTPESHVNLENAFSFQADEPFTVAAWARVDGEGVIFGKMDEAAGHRGVDIMISSDGAVNVHLIHEWPKNAIKVITDKKLPFGQWSHIAVTYDGKGKAGGVTLYLSGRKAEWTAEVDALTSTIETSTPLLLGRRSASLFLKGALTDFRVFDRALPERRVQSLVEETLAARLPAELNATHRDMLAAFFQQRGDDTLIEAQKALDAKRNEKTAFMKDEVATVMIMEALPEPKPTYRLERGAYDHPDTGEALQPDVPAFLNPLPTGVKRDRLTLAKWLVDRQNPLTARVTVNRLWAKFFGTGLVASVDNFGLVGDAPSNQALLDWLAVTFMESGWNLQAIQRLIVDSAAYRQQSNVTPALRERDPANRLLARGPRFRLPAELIRDNALAVSGLLVDTIGGPSVKPYQPEGLWDELAGGANQGPYEQATGDGLYRRSLYTYRKRTVSHPTTSTFDAPSWEVCTLKRARTNTPLQALALLNDTTYVEAARGLAERMLTEAPATPDARIAHGFQLVTGRMPSPTETDILLKGIDGYLATFTASSEETQALLATGERPVPDSLDQPELAAYTALAGVLLNLDETITKE